MIIPSLCVSLSLFPSLLFSPAIPLRIPSGLGAPRGIRFSDITATSSMVHWTVPRANVDSYRVTFVPLQGGECKGQENIVASLLGILSHWRLLFREIKPLFFFTSPAHSGYEAIFSYLCSCSQGNWCILCLILSVHRQSWDYDDWWESVRDSAS